MFEDVLGDYDLSTMIAAYLTARIDVPTISPTSHVRGRGRIFPRPTPLLFLNHRLRERYLLLLSEAGVLRLTTPCSEPDRRLIFTLVPVVLPKIVLDEAGEYQVAPVQLPYAWNVSIRTPVLDLPLARNVPAHLLWKRVMEVLPSVVTGGRPSSRLTYSVLEAAVLVDAKAAFFFADDGFATPGPFLEMLQDWGIATTIRKLLAAVCVPMMPGLIPLRSAHRTFVIESRRAAHEALFRSRALNTA